MSEDIRTEMARQYQNASTLAYKAIDYGIEQTELALSRIALCVHRRADIFGADTALCGNYITTTIQAAQSLSDQAVDTLTYARFFDTVEDKDAVYEDVVERVLTLHTVLSATNSGLLKIAQTDQIDKDFPAAPETDNPRALLLQCHMESLEAFHMGRIMAATRRDGLAALYDAMIKFNLVFPENDILEDRVALAQYRELCERNGQQIFGFETQLKEMRFQP